MNILAKITNQAAVEKVERIYDAVNFMYRCLPISSVEQQAVLNFFEGALRSDKSFDQLKTECLDTAATVAHQKYNTYRNASLALTRQGWVVKEDGTWRQPQPKRGIYERDVVNVISDFVNSEGLRYYVIEYAQLPGRPFLIRDHQLVLDLEVS